VEWVETTGKTMEEAKDAALDELGVDEHDAEFEVVDEPRAGLFGRLRGEARVRARVAPRQHRPKPERRERRRRAPSPSAGRGSSPAPEPGVAAPPGAAESPASLGGAAPQPLSAAAATAPTEPGAISPERGATMDVVTAQDQAVLMEGFLEGLLDAFGATAEITSHDIDEETVEIEVVGADLGLLIGPKGQTLQAVHDLARTVVQRRALGPHQGRVRIDIGGYRRHRREALERFTRQLAEEVQRSGVAKALEPMSAIDRKVVHDTANGLAGVATSSEGEEPRRRVVIAPSPS
jgi:spoIIIJ-associated protein